jgi:hypothetical protein
MPAHPQVTQTVRADAARRSNKRMEPDPHSQTSFVRFGRLIRPTLGAPTRSSMSDPVEQKLIEEIGQRIAWYSTALMRVNANVVYPLKDVFIGCGTFVQIDDRYGILTAHHVVKELIPPFRLGLILKLEQAESFMIDSDHLTIYELAVSDEDDQEAGHDLAFIELYQPDVGTIKATKHFLNLSLERNTVLPTPLRLDQGAWFIWGAAAERNTIEPSEHGLKPIIGLHGLCGPGLAVNESQDSDFDYIQIQVNYGEGYETPRNLQGYSGGGL